MRIRTAFVCLALVGLLVLAGLPLRSSSAGAATPSWQCWGPGLPDPCRNPLYGIAVVPGSGGSDVWAVGGRGTILHWNGSAWAKVASPTTETLRAVAMVRSNLGIAVGHNGAVIIWNGAAWSRSDARTDSWFRTVAFTPGSDGSQAWAAADKAGIGLFSRWNGTIWESRIGGQNQFFPGTIWGLSMLAADNGWAVGESFQGTGMNGQVYRWNGTQWSSAPSPTPRLYAVEMLSATDGWIVGQDGALAHWDGAAWGVVSPGPTSQDLFAVDLRSADEGWAVGEAGTILRWHGSAWATVASPVSQDLRGVAVAAANDAWAVGVGGVILRWDGTRWKTIAAPALDRLEDVAITPGSGGGDAWAVGSSRNLYHWDGGTWQAVSGPSTGYYAASMLSPTDGWAAGLGGRMNRWNGQSWAEAGRWESALDMALLAPNNGWAVGWGKIQHWDGNAWSLVTSPSTRTYYGMDAVSATDIWAVGDGGVIVHYNGTNWSSVTSPVTSWLVDVSMASASEGWAVGNTGVFLRWNGAQWSRVQSGLTYTTMRGVSVLPSSDGTVGWAVGDGGEAYWLHSGTWSAGNSPTANDLWAVKMVSANEAWAVGNYGVIMHWSDPSQTPTATHPVPPTATRPPTPTATPSGAALTVRIHLPLLRK